MLYKPYPAIFIGFPSAKDPTWESRYPGEMVTSSKPKINLIWFRLGRSTITVVSFAPYSWFAQWSNLAVKKRGDEYNSMKNAIGQQIIDQVTHLYPNLKVHSPLTFEPTLQRSFRESLNFLERDRPLQCRDSDYQRTLPQRQRWCHLRSRTRYRAFLAVSSIFIASRKWHWRYTWLSVLLPKVGMF